MKRMLSGKRKRKRTCPDGVDPTKYWTSVKKLRTHSTREALAKELRKLMFANMGSLIAQLGDIYKDAGFSKPRLKWPKVGQMVVDRGGQVIQGDWFRAEWRWETERTAVVGDTQAIKLLKSLPFSNKISAGETR